MYSIVGVSPPHEKPIFHSARNSHFMLPCSILPLNGSLLLYWGLYRVKTLFVFFGGVTCVILCFCVCECV